MTDTTLKLAELQSLKIPHITAIEFPGNVINNNKAIELLGGQATVGRVSMKTPFFYKHHSKH